MTTKANANRIRTGVKAGGFNGNHSQSGMALRSNVNAGIGFGGNNHNQGILLKSRVKAGGGYTGGNHNQSGMALRSTGVVNC